MASMGGASVSRCEARAEARLQRVSCAFLFWCKVCFGAYRLLFPIFAARGARRWGVWVRALPPSRRNTPEPRKWEETYRLERLREVREPKIFSVRRNERNQSPNAFQRRGVSPRTNHTLSGGATSHQPPAWTNKQVSRTSSRPPLLPPLLPPLFTPVRPPRPHVSLRERAPRLEGEAARGRPLAAGGAPWGWRAARLWAPWPERGPLAPHRAATPCWRRPVVQASSGGKGRGAALWPREKMACVARPATVSIVIVSIAIVSIAIVSVAIVSLEEGIAAL